MDDLEVKRLREKQVRAAKDLAEVEELMQRLETQIAAVRPDTLFWRSVMRLMRWCYNGIAAEEEKARLAARKTWDR